MMKLKKIKYKIFPIIITFFCFLNFDVANALTSFSLSVPEGQNISQNEFYHGRCVRVDILLDTDGHATGGADLEINYDNSRVSLVNSDCTTAATSIYHDFQFDNYINNHVTSNKIVLGAYDNYGNNYNGSGRFAYFYFLVLDGNGDYDFNFEFTFSNTTDTNLAELGSGNDILENVNGYTLHFADDNDIPFVNNQIPDNNSNNIQVISNIDFKLNDRGSGVDINTLNTILSGNNWGSITYNSTNSELSYTCHATNANRIDYCDTSINPSKNLYYCENYPVNITISDLGNPIVHTLSNYNYSFRTEDDNDAPNSYNLNPTNGDVSVDIDSNINFNIKDVANPGNYPGTGINVSTLKIKVSANNWQSKIYTSSSSEVSINPIGVNDYGNIYDYEVSINPSEDFPQNTLVNVEITVEDYGCPSVNSMTYNYSFKTKDSTAPICDLFSPDKNSINIDNDEKITFRCRDNGSGIDIDSFYIVVDGKTYKISGNNNFTYTGNPSEYYISIDPIDNFSDDYALEVVVNGADFSGNFINQISYGLAVTSDNYCNDEEESDSNEKSCPICKTCTKCSNTDYVLEKKCEIKKDEEKYNNCDILTDEEKELLISTSSSKIPISELNNIKIEKINGIDVNKGNKISFAFFWRLLGINQENAKVNIYSKNIIFEGKALPNSRITLLIGKEAFIVTGLADKNGIWKIEMKNIFKVALHEVSAVSISQDNYIVHTKDLVKFNIYRFPWCLLIIIILTIVSIFLYIKYRKIKKELEKVEYQVSEENRYQK